MGLNVKITLQELKAENEELKTQNEVMRKLLDSIKSRIDIEKKGNGIHSKFLAGLYDSIAEASKEPENKLNPNKQ